MNLSLPEIYSINNLNIIKMYKSNIRESGHVWHKQNLVTIVANGRMYDEMVCSNCGMKGKRVDIEHVDVSEAYKLKDIKDCPKRRPVEVPKKVKIVNCTANGEKFENLTPGSVHSVVEPPEGYENDLKGLWVMGVGEPVKLLNGEFVNV